jgi:hypothetical protein
VSITRRPHNKTHPAAVEGRQQKIAHARLLAVVRLPAGTIDDAEPAAFPDVDIGR